MAPCPEADPKEPSSYSSPLRVLARAFEKSRDRWKQKYKGLQERIKAFRTEVRDLRRSRDRWQAKADTWKQQLDQLRAEIRRHAEQSPPAPSVRSSQRPTRHLS
jgi:septal ring factor EnvC (AmiA/AmiB activator)